MSEPKLLQGELDRLKVLTCYRDTQVAAAGTAVILGKFVLPFTAKIRRIDYAGTAATSGTAGTSNLEAQVAGTAITENVDDEFDSAAEHVGSLNVLKIEQEYAAGTVIDVVITTDADTTLDYVAISLSILPVLP